MSFNKHFDEIFKNYDIRGVVNTNFFPEYAFAIGVGMVRTFGLENNTIAIGYDMRQSSPLFAHAFAEGVLSANCKAVNIGLCSTDISYFVSGSQNCASAMITASHNPADYNGIKLSLPGAQGVSSSTGLESIKEFAKQCLEQNLDKTFDKNAHPVLLQQQDAIKQYASYLRELVDLRGIKPIKVVVDAGNAMAGLTIPAVLQGAAGLDPLPVRVVPMYFELDGTFPNHEANPLVEENLRDLKREVLVQKADLGLAFDGDADRCFVIDENGSVVSPSAICAIIASRMLSQHAKEEGASEPNSDAMQQRAGEGPFIVHNLLTSRHVPEIIRALGGTPIKTQVGHSIIKSHMAKSGAIFGGEHSAHYYFRDFWGADTGMLAAMHILAILGDKENALSMSQMAAKHTPYCASGEINFTVQDPDAVLQQLKKKYGEIADFEELDGITFFSRENDGSPWWWFNVRKSNTEPLLRLNVEAFDSESLQNVTKHATMAIKDIIVA